MSLRRGLGVWAGVVAAVLGMAWTAVAVSRRPSSPLAKPPVGVAVVGASTGVVGLEPRSVSRPPPAAGPLGAPSMLTVDDTASPVGLDLTDVRFGWHLGDPRPGAVQTAYRILVTNEAQHVVWDSGRVASADQAFIPYRGSPLRPDSVYRWTVQTWAASGGPGPLANTATFGTGLGDHDWKALWIRRLTVNPVENTATDQLQAGLGLWQGAGEYTYVRKETTLNRSPIIRAVAYVAADQQYELYLNGTMAAKGGPISYPDHQYYEATDVGSRLRPGAANALGIVYSWQGPGKGRPQGSPGVLAEVSVWHEDGTHELIGTDGSWRVQAGAWLPGTQRNTQGDPVDDTENINGLAYPAGWDSPGYPDLTWAPATVIGAPPVTPWTHLSAARTRIVVEPVKAVSLIHLPSGAVVADFGQVIAASPAVTFHRGSAGRRVTMHAGYVLDGAAVSTTRGTQGTDMSYSYVQRGGGSETFRAFDYLGYRYLQIDNPGESLAPADVVAWARHTAMPAGDTATFSTSNATVDAVYQLAAHSALFTSQEQFIDTPTREKGPFLRDGFNESQAVMAGYGDQNLTRKSLLEFADSQLRYWPDGRLNAIYPSGEYPYVRDIPDFTEIYPEWVWQYWMRTGDRELLAAVYPVIANIAAYVARAINPVTGLVTQLPGGGGAGSAYNFGIVDWPASMRYGYDMNTAARTTVNMLAVDVFQRTADIATAVGRPASETAAQAGRRDALRNAINRHLERPDGVYVDGLEANGAQSTHASQHANAYAIAYGIVPAARLAAVAAYAAGKGMAMGPQTVQALLQALRISGRTADLVHLVTDQRADGWARILARGGTFAWEDWSPSDAAGDSMSHGWGSTVLVELQVGVLGVTPTSPGFATFDVSPPLAGVDHASGTVPTPRGTITVAWSRVARTVDVGVPAGAIATVRLPAGPAVVGSGTYHFSTAG